MRNNDLFFDYIKFLINYPHGIHIILNPTIEMQKTAFEHADHDSKMAMIKKPEWWQMKDFFRKERDYLLLANEIGFFDE